GSGKGTLSVPELLGGPQAQSLETVAAFNRRTAALQASDRAERVPVAGATSALFTTLGVRRPLGRAFGHEEDLKANDGVALVSAAAFLRCFGSDPSVVGRSVTMDGQSRQIIRVLPEGFRYPGDYDFFIPYGFTET